MRRLSAVLVLGLMMVLMVPKAMAHPHAWVDVKSTVVFDDSGNVIALDLDWLFDAFYTVFVLEDITAAGDPPQQALLDLAAQNLKNLHEYNYFLEVLTHGARWDTGAVDTYETNLVGDRLRMAFRVPLAAPLNAKTDAVSFKIYDPTYYIEMVHVEENPVAFDGAPLGACSAVVVEPSPDEEAVTFAAMLDQSQTGPNDLGRLFAQTVQVRCQ